MKRLALCAVALASLTGCADSQLPLAPDVDPSAAAVVLSEPAPGQATTNYEIKCMQGMIDHHMMAVMTAEPCIDKAVHEELRSMCEQIVAIQTREIETMQAWLESWYGVTYEPTMKPGMMQEVERLAALDGADFEIAFMEMMIKHHEGAIREAQHCVDRAYHPELIALCEDIIAAQQAEIQQLQTWLCEWYGECK